MILHIICAIFALSSIRSVNSEGLYNPFKWKQLDYYNRGYKAHDAGSSGSIAFPGQYNNAISDYQVNDDSSYIPYNNVPFGATHYRGRLFVTVPRRRVGIPSTLNYIDLNKDSKQKTPKLRAYPDFETNQLTSNFPHLVSVYRTTADSFGRLWFIDTGMLEYPNNFTQIQRPIIWVMDLSTDKVIRRFEIPASIAAEGRGFASITIDTDQGCEKTFAYAPDLLNNRLHVYSFESNKMWSFQHNYFHFDPIAGDLTIGGQSFRWDDGIFSVALGPSNGKYSRDVYFHAMASNNEFVVSNSVLQNETNALRSDHGTDFRLLGNRGEGKQSTMHAYDPSTDVLFYAEIQQNGVGCWNTRTPFTPDNHGRVARDMQLIVYPSDLTIDEEGTLWVLTNNLPIYIYSKLDVNQFNFRVYKRKTSAAVYVTKCA